MKKSSEKSAALWLESARGSAFIFSKGERERERVRVRHFDERANALPEPRLLFFGVPRPCYEL